MSKKILSLALAVVMLFSICAVAVSAVDGDGSEVIGLVITSDAKVGAPAGTPVKVTYSVDLPDGIDELQMCIGNIAIGWNTAAYSYVSRTWGADFGQYMKSTAAVTTTDVISTNILKKANANDTANGYNKAIQVQMLYDGSNSTSSTGFPVYDNQEIFTLEFVTEKTLEVTDVIGVVEGAYGQSFFKVCYFDGTKIGTYNVANIDMTRASGVAPAAASFDVYELAQKTRAYEKSAGVYKTATFFGFKNIAPAFNAAGTSEFITDITATVTIDGTPVAASDIPVIRFVYDLGDGEYGFRVILDNIADGDADITITPVVTTTDGATYNVETVTFTAASAEAVA